MNLSDTKIYSVLDHRLAVSQITKSIGIKQDIHLLLQQQAAKQGITLECLLNGVLSEWLLKNLRIETAATGLQTTYYLSN